MRAVDAARAKDRKGYNTNANTKLLAAINTIAFERIPADPTDAHHRLGNTLGADYRHWFRDKFGNGRFRLFFRFDTKSKIIVYAWVNDAETKRTYGSKNDAYAVFAKMLNDGNPPDSWAKLVAECSQPGIVSKVRETFAKR